MLIRGKDKQKTGNIISANPTDNTVVVAGVNIISKHQKPRRQGEEGGLIKTEGAFYASKVGVYCAKCDKGVRVGHKVVGDKKVRVCAKCGEEL